MAERRIWRSRLRKRPRTARRACLRSPVNGANLSRRNGKSFFSDPAARGGIREIVASGDVIVSQRTPLKGYTGAGSEPSIALTRLNLDSDRAFEIANKQAIARRIGFSWVDYTLRANAAGGAPMWILRLHDNMGIKSRRDSDLRRERRCDHAAGGDRAAAC